MLREGRFDEGMDSDAAEYSASIEEDLRLFGAVVKINMAHVFMLSSRGILEEEDAEKIFSSLSDLKEKGVEALDLRAEVEDIHMAIEEYVEEDVGEEIGGNLHTAKSRNDQVAASIRMVLREEVLGIQEYLLDLISEMSKLAMENTETVMPGYTHLQVAEPTTFAHYLSSYSQALLRDVERINETYETINQNPLGSCALSGTSFPIDRRLTSDLLGFNGVLENTIDATSSRDFALETMSDLSILMTNLSRFVEELINWSSSEFDMVDIPEEFCSTSSIMPQKKNPQTAEMTRAKTGEVIGDLVSGLSIMKSLPQAYNLDLQEITPILWNSVDKVKDSLKVMTELVKGLEPKPEQMRKNAKEGYATLTELANVLVRKSNIPFRKAHTIVGKLASKIVEEEKSLDEIEISDLRNVASEVIDEELVIEEEGFEEALSLDKGVKRRDNIGGPSPESVGESLSGIMERVDSYEGILSRRENNIIESDKKLLEFLEGK